MLTPLLTYINDIHPISDEIRSDLEKYLEIIEVPKHHLLLKEGQRNDYVFVVLKGLLRMYYLKDGEEVCSRFTDENHISLSVNSFYSRIPGYEYIETLEPSVIARIHHDNLQRLYNDYIEYNYIGRIITQEYFIKSEERLYLLRKQSAEERYLFFLEHYPGLLQRVPLKHIATFLGITLETLSRIRNKLSKSAGKKKKS